MHPLTEKHLEDINSSLDALKASKEIIQRAKQAGLNVDDLQSKSQEIETKLLGIRRAFFPQS